MQSGSDLERFLQSQSSSGEYQSEGSFTLAREEALRKLAGFQLPFVNAWAVKLVQCAVAARASSPIQIDMSTHSLNLEFQLSAPSIDVLEAAFFDPGPAQSQAVRHLLTALWAVGLKQDWPFQVTLCGWEESLIWDGQTLSRLPLERVSDRARVTIVLLKRKAGVFEWTRGVAASQKRNSELRTTLKNRCYTCPLPLTVDGTRLDTLYNCPSHGPTTRDHVIFLGGAESSDLRPLQLPPGTFDIRPKVRNRRSFWSLAPSDPTDLSGLPRVSKKVLRRTERIETCAAPFLLTAHRDAQHFVGQATKWRDRQEASKVYWVLDGAVIDEDLLDTVGTTTSLAAFLSAEGLATDLSSFALTDQEEKRRRLVLARQVLGESLDRLITLEQVLTEKAQSSTLTGRIAAGGILTLGIATLWTLPIAGLGIMGVGGGLLAQAGKNHQHRNEKLLSSVKTLQDRLLDR